MNREKQRCPYCNQPLAPDSRFCEWCGKPITRQGAAPPAQRPTRPAGPPPPPQPAASTPSSANPKRRSTRLILLLGGGLAFVCLLVAAGGVFLWWRGQAAEPQVSVDFPATDTPRPATTLQPTELATPKTVGSPVALEPPASVVEDFIRTTLGSVPGAAVDYDRARSLMTASYAAQFDTPAFIPSTYGIQEGPIAYEVSSEEISAATATVIVVGYWGEEPGRRWSFVLNQEAGAWKIAAISGLPTSGADRTDDTASASTQALFGEWQVAEGEGSDLSDRFRILQEPDGRLRVRWVDEYTDIEGIEDLERFYLEIEPQGEGRWAGEAISVSWDPETGKTTEEGCEPVVLILSDNGQQLLIGPPDSEGVAARRVDGP